MRVFIQNLNTLLGKELIACFAEGGHTIVGTLLQASNDDHAAIITASSGVEWKLNDGEKPKFVSEIVESATEAEAIVTAASSCDVIILDLALQPALCGAVVGALSTASSAWDAKKTVVAVSSILTWARTPTEAEDEETVFTEEDFRTRRAHLNWREHVVTEKAVSKAKTDWLKTYVVTAGAMYGRGEGFFHWAFRGAWEGTLSSLPVFGDGENVIPTIHVADAAKTVFATATTAPRRRYILAVDAGNNTQKELIGAISSALGDGSVSMHPKDNAATSLSQLSIPDLDMLMTNIRAEPLWAFEQFDFEWKAHEGFLAALDDVVADYRAIRGLNPLKVVVLGPPGVGKSFTAAKIAHAYGLPHLQIKDVLTEMLAPPEKKVRPEPVLGEDGEPIEDVEDEEDEEEPVNELAVEAEEALDEATGRYHDEFLVRVVREKLARRECANQGFVLDGWPKTREQAAMLFGGDPEADDVDANGVDGGAGDDDLSGPGAVDRAVFPDALVVLSGSDSALKERVMNMSEEEVAGTHWNEAGMARRLAAYRSANTIENTVVNYFEEREVVPMELDGMAEWTSERMIELRSKIGRVHNYGPSREQLETEAAAEEAAAEEAAAAAAAAEAAKVEAEAVKRAALDSQHQERLAEIRAQEEAVLKVKSTPLRAYLMKNVMPTLTEGLLELNEVRPSDPVDYLAEWLFKNGAQLPTPGRSTQ